MIERKRGRGGRREGIVYRFLRYLAVRYLSSPFLSLVDYGYDQDESFEVSTKEKRRKRERELQVTSYKSAAYIYFTLPGTYIPYLTLPTPSQSLPLQKKLKLYSLLYVGKSNVPPNTYYLLVPPRR